MIRDPDDEIHLSDLRRFVALIEMEPAKGSIFSKYSASSRMHAATGSHLIRYFSIHRIRIQGLAAYFDALGEDARECALSPWYKSCEIPVKQIARFAEAVGVQIQLKVAEADADGTRNGHTSMRVTGKGVTNHPLVDQDWRIEALDRLLESPSVPLSRLVWRTMRELLSDKSLKACYQKVERYGCRTADSQLFICCCRRHRGYLKQRRNFVLVQPAKRPRGLLPEGFPVTKALGMAQGGSLRRE